MANTQGYVKTLGNAYAGMVFEVLSWLDVLFFQAGILFPAVIIMENDR